MPLMMLDQDLAQGLAPDLAPLFIRKHLEPLKPLFIPLMERLEPLEPLIIHLERLEPLKPLFIHLMERLEPLFIPLNRL